MTRSIRDDGRQDQDRGAPGGAPTLTRRSVLGYLGATTAVAAMAVGLPACGDDDSNHRGTPTPTPTSTPTPDQARAVAARDVRREAAEMAYVRPHPAQQTNGDEERYPTRIGNFSKTLPHNDLGEVDPAAYDALLVAVASGKPDDFEAIPLGGTAKLANPQGGLAFDLEGPDSHALAQPPPPRFDSAEIAGEMVELYWMALLRDVHFVDYDMSTDVAAACTDLSNLSDFRGPMDDGDVTPALLFRGSTPGELIGPYVSQFLLRDYACGSIPVTQRQRTPVPGIDYLTDVASWLAIQNGQAPVGAQQFDPTLRHIRNLRDLARYVQADFPCQAYLNAALMLIAMGVPTKPGNPYKTSTTQSGFVTFGGPHILGLVSEVASRALKAVWYQKWFVHRRLRPEEYAGRVQMVVSQRADYPVNVDVLESEALERLQQRNGTALLPMLSPDGCPTHPAYGAGHNTIAGACVTILKAWFAEDFVIPNPVVASADGTTLVPYVGGESLTVGNELNKLAGNVAQGRNGGGVHWRSDYPSSIRLGEDVAIGMLEEQKITFNEQSSFTFTRFDGSTITI